MSVADYFCHTLITHSVLTQNISLDYLITHSVLTQNISLDYLITHSVLTQNISLDYLITELQFQRHDTAFLQAKISISTRYITVT